MARGRELIWVKGFVTSTSQPKIWPARTRDRPNIGCTFPLAQLMWQSPGSFEIEEPSRQQSPSRNWFKNGPMASREIEPSCQRT
jgi:hypothetical protein